jgi:hypothetical protein
MLKDVPQAFGVAGLTNERSDVEELGEIGQRVPITRRPWRHPEEGTT